MANTNKPIFTFGKYKWKTYEEVAILDPQFIINVYDNDISNCASLIPDDLVQECKMRVEYNEENNSIIDLYADING